MENGALAEVEGLLVEPQDGHFSMDSLCFDGKISENTNKIRNDSCSFGGSDPIGAKEKGDVLNREACHNNSQKMVEYRSYEMVLDVMPNDVENGYFRPPNDDIYNMGDDYLLGIEFAESITHLDYGSSDLLQTSVLKTPSRASFSDLETQWKSDLFRVMETSDLTGTPSPEESETLKVPSSSSRGPRNHSPEGISSDVKKLENAEALPSQKRLRKPTKRYIDELEDPSSGSLKKKRNVSSSAPKSKSSGVKAHKNSTVSRGTELPPEESSVIAIQVPFGSLEHKNPEETYEADKVLYSNSQTYQLEWKDAQVSAISQKKKDSHVTVPPPPKRRDDFMSRRKMDFPVTETPQKKREIVPPKRRDDFVTSLSPRKRDFPVPQKKREIVPLKRRDDFVKIESQRKMDFPVPQKKRDGRVKAASQRKDNSWTSLSVSPKKKMKSKKWDGCIIPAHQNKKDRSIEAIKTEEVDGRRKHHILWTIPEVEKLVDGVSQYGVGRWSRIKKLFFSTSDHRTSVDLKDKWRNLLKASGVLEQGKRQAEKKRSLSWRPLPNSIVRRVSELAAAYPYPKMHKPRTKRVRHVSPDRSTDITLSDYRRILLSTGAS